MKRARAIASLLLAGAAFWALDNRHGTFPALGKLLDPFAGFWQNGSRSDDIPRTLAVPGLREEVRVVWDDRRVPHIFAANEHDLFLAQGYVAASLRLWQMDLQSLFTAGRISEVIGPAGLRRDIFSRRFGLPWAAENQLRAFREDPETRAILEAFTAGVNARIRELGRKDLPVEYKILDYRPEPWTDYKCALLLKATAYALTSYNRDALMTRTMKAIEKERGSSGWEDLGGKLFPFVPPLVEPVIPAETPLEFVPLPVPAVPVRGEDDAGRKATGRSNGSPTPTAGLDPAAPSDPDTFGASGAPPRPGVGSNNWAVSGRLTASGSPILCNDMHLGLSLPAVWYEIQLTAPGINVRGVAFPAAPLVIAGYNENIAWGFTSGADDVLDWYDVTFKDGNRTEYLYGGEWRQTSVREETIKVRGRKAVVDRIVFTHHGPVVRWPDEPPFPDMDVPPGAALRWLGHDPSNEITTLYGLDRAKDYADYVKALETWDCPALNIAYADREGTIALWHDGKFPLRWRGQGRFVLDGSDPADDWRGWIPHAHVPHAKDPGRGFVSSANQMPVAAGYPYYLGWDYEAFERGARINEILRSARDVTPEDMVRMQTDVLDIRARAVLPRLLEMIRGKPATEVEKRCFEELRGWNFEVRAAAIAPTIFGELWSEINRLTWDDKKPKGLARMPRPESQVMVDEILNQPHGAVFDLVGRSDAGSGIETLDDIARKAFRAAVSNLEKRLGPWGEAWRWGLVKGTELQHLAKIPGFSRKIESDGAGNVIDAIDTDWGPSWRMVVELGTEIKAWGNYPGGQSGQPGSRFYEDRVGDWAAGRAYELVFLRSADEPDPRIVGRTVMRGER